MVSRSEHYRGQWVVAMRIHYSPSDRWLKHRHSALHTLINVDGHLLRVEPWCIIKG